MSSPAKSTAIVLRERPTEKLAESHFERIEAGMPTAGPNEVLVRVAYLSIDAASRAWMQGATYRSQVHAGTVMDGHGIGQIVASNAAGLAAGDWVTGDFGWRSFAALPASDVKKVPPRETMTHYLSVYGVSGLTAYVGALIIGAVKAGDTVLISAAAGAVGSIAGQIAKLKGARAVGIAGGEAKSRQVVERFGYDACIDYKSGDVRKGIAQHCPDGVDVYFDNVGGPVLQAALFQMRQHGRIVCCGAVSGYDAGALPAGPMGVPGLLVVRRIRMEGFIVMDQPPEVIAEAQKSLETWVREGKIAVAEDIVDGLENAPRALIGLLAGDNVGKRIVRVS